MNRFTSRSISILVSLLIFLSGYSLQAQSFTKAEIARWQQKAKQVTITRDGGYRTSTEKQMPTWCLGYYSPNAKMTLVGWKKTTSPPPADWPK